MKNLTKILRGITGTMLITALIFALAACGGGDGGGPDDPNNPNNPGGQYSTFTSINDFKEYLSGQNDNTVTDPYRIKLNNITDEDMADLKATLMVAENINKYVYLDLSGSAITLIPNNAFSIRSTGVGSGGTMLTGIIIPNTVLSIGDEAFAGCTNLGSMIIPNSVISIGSFCFYKCASLAGITIGNGVTEIKNYVFDYCVNLTAINVNSGNSAYASENGVLYNKDKTSIIRYPPGKTAVSFTIPASVTGIGSTAFDSCASFTNITIPAGVTRIGGYAFDHCTNLASVTFQGTITSANFSGSYPFSGDLRDKYLAVNGGIGTYTKIGSTWTKQ